jgi:hypothetical protein
MESKRKIVAVYEMEDLGPAIKNYPQSVRGLQKAASPGQGLDEKAGIYSQKLNELCSQLMDQK